VYVLTCIYVIQTHVYTHNTPLLLQQASCSQGNHDLSQIGA
jgi:hypothetical protein